MMIERSADHALLTAALRRAPVTLLIGPRQAGKSTLAREFAAATTSAFFDLENPQHAQRLADPLLALSDLTGLVVIDEAQHAPHLFPVLRVLADRPSRPATFLVLGSASPDVVGLAAQSLAGRVEIVELGGLRLADVGAGALDTLWLQGSLPASFTRSAADSAAWRDNYVSTFLERDLAQLGFRVPATQMRRFWTMLAHYHGQTWNGAELARSMGVSQPTIRRYLDTLTDALMVRQLSPWYANVGKRVVRSPKVFLRDSGVLHSLLGITSTNGLLDHPKSGASWEGLVVEQVAMTLPSTPLHFWGTQSGAEIDLYFTIDGRGYGVEIKRSMTPSVTPSIRHAIADLDLQHVAIIYPGDERYPLADKVEVLPLAALADPGFTWIPAD
ncbi:MAG: ATP-binding protein [Ilumatobacteraceae bacterium]